MRPIVRSVAVALVVLPACARTPPSARSEVAASAPSSSPSTSPSPSALPEPDLRCTRDEDCDLDYEYLVDGKCCRGTCSPRAASTAHIEAVAALCKRLGRAADGCPKKKCAGVPDVACVAGKCTLR